jgi:predicted ATP-dependent endonuclease of OLD family
MVLESKKGIRKISVSGFKSLATECSIEIRPLTILAGANSSGKSSIIQPLLLMKQTLESSTDYGALRFDGDNLKFTSANQILAFLPTGEQTDCFTIEVELADSSKFKNTFKKPPNQPIDLVETIYYDKDEVVKSTIDMTSEEIDKIVRGIYPHEHFLSSDFDPIFNRHWQSVRFFCFIIFTNNELEQLPISRIMGMYKPYLKFATEISSIIHLQGLRSLERILPVTGISQNFSGDFVKYIASLIYLWQTSQSDKLQELNTYLSTLKLSQKIEATQINDTQIELKVNRALDSTDMVNIVDVGSGVSQVLPVLVALVVAEPDQLVYLEEPEIHLHPRAQANLGEIIVDAANRGVRVVLETHSDLLLRRIQSLVAEDEISPDQAILHWFSRDEDGFTKITTADMDATGAFGDFPEDFSEVDLQEESRYIEAAETKLLSMAA